jgi:hypothetical protein
MAVAMSKSGVCSTSKLYGHRGLGAMQSHVFRALARNPATPPEALTLLGVVDPSLVVEIIDNPNFTADLLPRITADQFHECYLVSPHEFYRGVAASPRVALVPDWLLRAVTDAVPLTLARNPCATHGMVRDALDHYVADLTQSIHSLHTGARNRAYEVVMAFFGGPKAPGPAYFEEALVRRLGPAGVDWFLRHIAWPWFPSPHRTWEVPLALWTKYIPGLLPDHLLQIAAARATTPWVLAALAAADNTDMAGRVRFWYSTTSTSLSERMSHEIFLDRVGVHYNSPAPPGVLRSVAQLKVPPAVRLALLLRDHGGLVALAVGGGDEWWPRRALLEWLSSPVGIAWLPGVLGAARALVASPSPDRPAEAAPAQALVAALAALEERYLAFDAPDGRILL